MKKALALLVVLGALAACNTVHHYVTAPGYTFRPVVEFVEPIEGPTHGAPPRMLQYNRELAVQCAYCHVEGDASTAFLTPEGTSSRLMMDLADRFKVTCAFCHDRSPTRFTRAGRFALRDMRDPERRFTCGKCHGAGFTRRP